MGIKKEFVAYNGERCDYHSVCNFEFNVQTNECDALIGSFRTEFDSKQRYNPIEITRIQCQNILCNENILEQIYREVIKDQRFSEGIQF